MWLKSLTFSRCHLPCFSSVVQSVDCTCNCLLYPYENTYMYVLLSTDSINKRWTRSWSSTSNFVQGEKNVFTRVESEIQIHKTETNKWKMETLKCKKCKSADRLFSFNARISILFYFFLFGIYFVPSFLSFGSRLLYDE